MKNLIVLALILLATMCACSPREERFWPLSNTSHDVNLGQSSPFGPRLMISQGNRYDFHRGVDIPTPLRTVAYAIDDGTVRIPGPSHSGFSDGVVQIRKSELNSVDAQQLLKLQLVHTGWDDDGDTSKKYYSTYIHMIESFLENMTVGDFVPRVTPVGLTWQTNGNFPHLHFEIRAGSLFQSHACNPWRYLPCPHCGSFRANVSVTFEESDDSCSALTRVSLPPNQLTFAAVRLTVTGAVSDYIRVIDLCEFNIIYTDSPAQSPPRLDNNTVIPDLVINPHLFSSASFGNGEWSTIDYTFLNLPGTGDGVAEIIATVYDVYGETVHYGPVMYSSTCSDATTSPPKTSTPTEATDSTTSEGSDSTTTTDPDSNSGCTPDIIKLIVCIAAFLAIFVTSSVHHKLYFAAHCSYNYYLKSSSSVPLSKK